MANTLHNVAREYVEIDESIKRAKEALKTLNARKAELADTLMSGMVEEGAASIDVVGEDGGRTKVYPMSKLFARRNPDVSEAQMFKALTDAGYEELIRYAVNANSLSAVVREIAEQNDVRNSTPSEIAKVLPGELGNVLTISNSPTLAIRRA